MEVVLAIGDTGLGKTQFAVALGAQQAHVSDGCQSVTRHTSFYRLENIVYIDTPGFDDPDLNISDEMRKQEILDCLRKENQSYITTVLWFCAPNDRMSASLQKQAGFISSIAAKDSIGNIWKNVIILIKQGRLFKGPQEAAQHANDQGIKPTWHSLHIIGVGGTQDRLFNGLSDADRKAEGGYKLSELPDFLNEFIAENGHREHPINILFLKENCIHCPATDTDKRLMPEGCHRLGAKSHSKKSTRKHVSSSMVHTRKLVTNSNIIASGAAGVAGGALGSTAAGVLGGARAGEKVGKHVGQFVGVATRIGPTAGSIAGSLVGATIGAAIAGGTVAQIMASSKIYECCHQQEGSEGCRPECCEKESDGCVDEWPCCQRQGDAEGCQDICIYCKEVKETPGCKKDLKHVTEFEAPTA